MRAIKNSVHAFAGSALSARGNETLVATPASPVKAKAVREATPNAELAPSDGELARDLEEPAGTQVQQSEALQPQLLSATPEPPIKSEKDDYPAVSAGFCTKRGPRRENQDGGGTFANAACVCDGVAMSDRGADASRITANIVLKALADGASPSEACGRAHRFLLHMRENLRAPSEASSPTAETTLALATWTDTYAQVLTVGDSRAFLFRDGALSLLTDGGRPEKGSNRLEAALGAKMNLVPHMHSCEFCLAPGDRILLCTDGVWDQPGFESMAAAALAERDTPYAAAVRIASQSAETGSDNATAAVVYVR